MRANRWPLLGTGTYRIAPGARDKKTNDIYSKWNPLKAVHWLFESPAWMLIK